MPRTSSRKPSKPKQTKGDGLARLQKILAAAGMGSRRQCEGMILEGRVEVDRKVVSQLGAKADPFTQEVRVDGNVLSRPKRVYYLVNKPPGVLSTNRDPSGRPRVIDLLAPKGERLFTVGRLDMSSEGLILATNDGELANLLTHPRYGVHKTYHVEVAGQIESAELARLEEGMYLAEGFARVVGARIKSRFKKSTLLEITLAEGRNREIRRLLARTGHKVMRLRRVALGPLRLGEVPRGASRPLTTAEIQALWHATTPAARREREEQKPRKSAKPTTTASEDSSDQKSTENKPTKAAVKPPKDRLPRRDASVADKRRGADDDQPAPFRLPRTGSVIGGPQRPVIIGGDSSSYMPQRSKPAAAAPPKAGARTAGTGRTGGGMAKTGRSKAVRRPKVVGRPKQGARAGGATRVKRRGAGRGESGG
jgi:23S rRNA pseudouridine2605 synthase